MGEGTLKSSPPQAELVSIYSNIEIWGAGFPRLCLPRVRFFRPSTEWQKLYLYLRTLKFWVWGSRSKTRKYFSFVDPVNWASYYDDKTFSFISPRGGVLLGSSIRSRELLQAWIGRQGRLATIQINFDHGDLGGAGGVGFCFQDTKKLSLSFPRWGSAIWHCL